MGNNIVKHLAMWGTTVCMGVLLTPPLNAQLTVASSAASSAAGPYVSVDVQHVTLKVALQHIAQQAGLTPFYSDAVTSIMRPVTLRVSNVPAAEAFALVLRGTGLKAVINMKRVSFGASDAGEPRAVGSITGTVIDGETRQPLSGVKVTIDDAVKGILTASDGTFGIANVSAGAHTILFRRIGYTRISRTVTASDGQAVTMTIALVRSVSTLDQVVVTGTVAETELRAVPNAMTVITAKQIEERGITKIDQLFRGDVPGAFAMNLGSHSNALLDEVTMFSRGATALSQFSAGTMMGTNPIKTYIDGIEMADPKYLSQIDPKSIERIEILTGPQASTIYGSNAINGVMQIFTKRGTTSSPQLTLNLLSGWIQNNFSSALTPQHDYSAQLSGIEGRISYNAGGAWNYTGPWTPAKQLTRTGGFGGTRLELPTWAGRVTTDITLRRTLTQSLQRGNAAEGATAFYESGWWSNVSESGLAQPTTRTLTGQTLGLTLSYVPTAWWSHEMGMGQDVSDTEQRYTMPGYTSIDDTTLLLQQLHTDRRSLHYVTTAHLSVTSFAQATVTAGADAWQTLASQVAVSPQTLTGTLIGSTGVTRQPDHNTGSFLQTQVGLKDRLFLTYGVRAEWNPNYGAEAQPNYAPRYGAAYTEEIETPFGPLTAKLRGAYGRSTRPPQRSFKVGHTIADAVGAAWSSVSPSILPYYGGLFYLYLPNPELTPEYQQGGEGGVELYLGTRGSLVVTHYNQTVDGLIALPNADSVRTLVPCSTFTPACSYTSLDADGYGYTYQLQYVNLGSIRNQGWELQGNVNIGPFTTQGTYSWTKSRVLGVNPRYRAYYANDPQYRPGATFRFLPEHTWALGITYAQGASSVGLHVMGTGQLMNDQNSFYFHHLVSAIRLRQNRFRIAASGLYANINKSYPLSDLTASHRFASRVEGVLQVQNLMDRYMNDSYAGNASIGRQTKLGVRVRTN